MAEKKEKAEVLQVQMTDGRTVGFAGKRRVIKETVIDDSKIMIDGDTVTIAAGAVCVRMDFRNGDTRLIPLPVGLLARFAGHGGEQKFGDELAAPADKPLSEEDMVLAIDDLNSRIQAGAWSQAREGGGGVSGASIVVKAIMEVTGKSLEEVKAFLAKKLADAEARGEKLTRNELYNAFRNPNSKTGQVIERMEREQRAKNSKVDADEALAELG